MSKIDLTNDTDFLDDLEEVMNDDNVAYTENAAMAFRTTHSAVLDFFASGGAFRSRGTPEIVAPFEAAYDEDALLAAKALFYFRDVRGGQGERRTFRTLLEWAAETHPHIILPNLRLIPEYGRWDDLFVLFGTSLEKAALSFIDVQLAADWQADRPSLLAKWLPSENASSDKTKANARKVRRFLGMSSKDYRKMLTKLRAEIGLVEQRMSGNEWAGIEYDKLPSKAGMLYRKAFARHDEDRYAEFLAQVESGEKTINAGTLYPYELVEKVMYKGENSATLEALWKNLPDYFDGTESSGIVVADTSASMVGRPITVAISLALYTAERNTGPFHNKFITFSSRPTLQSVEGETLSQKVQNLSRAHWDMNTDVKAVFDLILDTAIKLKAAQAELPTHLYIVSDMEFDRCGGARANERLFQTIEREYKEAGYKMPFLVFWNVDSRNDQQPMTMDQRGFQLVSGCSPSIFTSLLSNSAVSAYDLMLEVLNSDRYAEITID